MYQVSLPCIAWFASLRSEEVQLWGKVPEAHIFVNGCHDNARVHMYLQYESKKS